MLVCRQADDAKLKEVKPNEVSQPSGTAEDAEASQLPVFTLRSARTQEGVSSTQ